MLESLNGPTESLNNACLLLIKFSGATLIVASRRKEAGLQVVTLMAFPPDEVCLSIILYLMNIPEGITGQACFYLCANASLWFDSFKYVEILSPSAERIL